MLSQKKGFFMVHDLNAITAWLGVLGGVVVGALQGLRFHDEHWLGGYSTWPRRLMRLGHVSFFGIAMLNLAFALTVARLGWRPSTQFASISLAAAQVLMPLICYLSAWRPAVRHLFFVPVGCVVIGIAGLLIGRSAGQL